MTFSFFYASKFVFSYTTIVKGQMNFLISSKLHVFSELYSGYAVDFQSLTAIIAHFEKHVSEDDGMFTLWH